MRGKRTLSTPATATTSPMPSPILRDLPEQLETARLIIRPPRAGDGSAVHSAVCESLPELRAFKASLPWVMAEPSIEGSEVFCREGCASFMRRTDLPMLVFAKADEELVGSSGLHRIDWSIPKFEIGFWCRTSRSGQGLMTEAVLAISEFALAQLGARRLECFTDEQNAAGRRLCERAGYRLEGILHNERIDPDGVLRNTCLYARTP